MKKVFYTVIILCISMFLVGCSGSSEAPEVQTEINQTSEVSDTKAEESQSKAASITIEPEQLISAKEAGQLIGEPVKTGEKSQMEAVGQKIVFYDPEQEGSLGFLQLSLTQKSSMPKGSTITPEEIYESTKAALDETSDFPVSDICDDCFSGTPGLHILSNGYYIVIGAGNSDDIGVQEILKQAGALAVANLEELL